MNTKALRQKILDLAIRGKLVPQDPNDEPAEVLLERIRKQKQQMLKEGKLKKKDIKNDTIIFKGEDNLHYEKFQDGTVKCIEDEIPFEVPKGWAWARLASICSLISDIDHKMPKAVDNGVLFLSAKDLLNDGTINFTDDVKMISEDDFLRLSRKALPQKDDIIYSRIGACLGKARVVTKDIRFLVSYSCCTIRPVIIDSAFLASILDGNFVLDQAKEGTQSVGVPDLGMASIKQFLIPIPPLVEQQRIDKCLQYTLDIIQQISNERNDLSRMVAQIKSKILDLAIRGKLVLQDPNDEPASVLLERIRAEKEELIKQGKIKRDKKESVIFKGEDNSYYEKIGTEVHCIDNELPFELPDSWMFVRLKHIGEIVGGGTPKTNISEYWDGNIPWLTPADFSGYKEMYVTSGARTITEIGLKSSSAQMLPANSVLYSSRAPIGYIAIAASPVSTNQGFKSVVPYDFAMSPYLYYCLKARTGDIIQRATGTTFKEISGSEMAETIISLPPITEQKWICEKVAQLFNVIITIEKSLN